MTIFHGEITWDENRRTGQGELTLRIDNKTIEVIPYDGKPISQMRDATEYEPVAHLFGDWDTIDHEGHYILVSRVEQ